MKMHAAFASTIALAIALSPTGSIIRMDADIQGQIDTLNGRVLENQVTAKKIIDLNGKEKRDPTEDEQTILDGCADDCEALVKRIKNLGKLIDYVAPAGRKTQAEPNTDDPDNLSIPAQARSPDSGRMGFRNFGEYALGVHGWYGRNDRSDARFQNAATTFGSEGIGGDGGFLVPPDFRTEIWEKIHDQENLQTRTQAMVSGGNTFVFPKDETTPWDFTNGIQVAWENEMGIITQTKPVLELESLRLNKLTGLVPVSEELIEDAPGLESYLRAKAPSKITAKINTAIVRGTGVGQPSGLLGASCLVSVAKEGGQAADTVLFANIVKMWSRMYAASRRNAIWLINQDIEPQLFQMAFDPGATSLTPAYMPANGLNDSPFANLMGRPVVPVEACSTLGDQGDIILVDLQQYMTVTKGQEVRTDVSMHLYFDQAAVAFRFILRIAGQPIWGSTITPQFGSATRSPIITLDERA